MGQNPLEALCKSLVCPKFKERGEAFALFAQLLDDGAEKRDIFAHSLDALDVLHASLLRYFTLECRAISNKECPSAAILRKVKNISKTLKRFHEELLAANVLNGHASADVRAFVDACFAGILHVLAAERDAPFNEHVNGALQDLLKVLCMYLGNGVTSVRLTNSDNLLLVLENWTGCTIDASLEALFASDAFSIEAVCAAFFDHLAINAWDAHFVLDVVKLLVLSFRRLRYTSHNICSCFCFLISFLRAFSANDAVCIEVLAGIANLFGLIDEFDVVLLRNFERIFLLYVKDSVLSSKNAAVLLKMFQIFVCYVDETNSAIWPLIHGTIVGEFDKNKAFTFGVNWAAIDPLAFFDFWQAQTSELRYGKFKFDYEASEFDKICLVALAFSKSTSILNAKASFTQRPIFCSESTDMSSMKVLQCVSSLIDGSGDARLFETYSSRFTSEKLREWSRLLRVVLVKPPDAFEIWNDALSLLRSEDSFFLASYILSHLLSIGVVSPSIFKKIPKILLEVLPKFVRLPFNRPIPKNTFLFAKKILLGCSADDAFQIKTLFCRLLFEGMDERNLSVLLGVFCDIFYEKSSPMQVDRRKFSDLQNALYDLFLCENASPAMAITSLSVLKNVICVARVHLPEALFNALMERSIGCFESNEEASDAAFGSFSASQNNFLIMEIYREGVAFIKSNAASFAFRQFMLDFSQYLAEKFEKNSTILTAYLDDLKYLNESFGQKAESKTIFNEADMVIDDILTERSLEEPMHTEYLIMSHLLLMARNYDLKIATKIKYPLFHVARYLIYPLEYDVQKICNVFLFEMTDDPLCINRVAIIKQFLGKETFFNVFTWIEMILYVIKNRPCNVRKSLLFSECDIDIFSIFAKTIQKTFSIKSVLKAFALSYRIHESLIQVAQFYAESIRQFDGVLEYFIEKFDLLMSWLFIFNSKSNLLNIVTHALFLLKIDSKIFMNRLYNILHTCFDLVESKCGLPVELQIGLKKEIILQFFGSFISGASSQKRKSFEEKSMLQIFMECILNQIPNVSSKSVSRYFAAFDLIQRSSSISSSMCPNMYLFDDLSFTLTVQPVARVSFVIEEHFNEKLAAFLPKFFQNCVISYDTKSTYCSVFVNEVIELFFEDGEICMQIGKYFLFHFWENLKYSFFDVIKAFNCFADSRVPRFFLTSLGDFLGRPSFKLINADYESLCKACLAFEFLDLYVYFFEKILNPPHALPKYSELMSASVPNYLNYYLRTINSGDALHSEALSIFMGVPNTSCNIDFEYYHCWKNDEWFITDCETACEDYNVNTLHQNLFKIAKNSHVSFDLLSQMKADFSFFKNNSFYYTLAKCINQVCAKSGLDVLNAEDVVFIPQQIEHSSNKYTILEFTAQTSKVEVHREAFIDFCIKDQNFLRAMAEIRHLSCEEIKRLFDCQIKWRMGDKFLALKDLESQKHTFQKRLIFERANYLICKWTYDLQLKRPSEIIQLLSPDNFQSCKFLYKAKRFISVLCMQNFRFFIESQNFESKELLFKEKESQIKALKDASKGKERETSLVIAQFELDKNEFEKMKAEQHENYFGCLQYSAECLACDDGKYDDECVFNFISVWFEGMKYGIIDHKRHLQLLQIIPLRKFMLLSHQIFAKFSSEEHKNGNVSLVYLCQQLFSRFPQHTFFQIYAINQGVPDYIRAFVKTAKEADLVMHLELLASSLLELSLEKVFVESGEKVSASARLKIHKMKNFPGLPVITAITSGNLDQEIPTVVSYSSVFTVLNGINSPKLIECQASDGRIYKQLLKGKDDLRQDAVTEQVFSIVNRLLTAKKMSIRTYRIIPLGVTGGVIEWIENAVTLGAYLISAHERLRPLDFSPSKCRTLMNDEFDKKDSTQTSKLGVYNKILSKFKPVFRHFFIESFSDVEKWFKARKTYAASLAINSMVGYIIGLGDRHIQNIMIDSTSGEIINIDLNLIFEQGKLLKIPEHIPFRLTPDLLDGLGSFGISGIFTDACVDALQIIRKNHSKIMTILQVFKHDPLYRWTLSKMQLEKFAQKQNPVFTQSSFAKKRNDKIDEADRVLNRIHEKLNGIEMNSLLSVEGQVQYLIKMATNPELLCKMYPGWQSWF